MSNFSDVVRIGHTAPAEDSQRTVNHSPGVTRVQHVPQHLAADHERQQAGTIGAEPVTVGPLTRVAGEVQRFTHGEAEAGSVGVARHVVSFEGTAGGSVLATLQRSGPSQSVELVPGNPSTRTDVRTALREGLLVRNAAGQLEDAPALQQRVQDFDKGINAPEVPQVVDHGADVFDPAVDAAWARDIADLPQSAYDTAQARAVAFLAHGQGTIEGMAGALARDAGLDPSAARELVENGLWVHQQAADKALSKVGLSGEALKAFYADARQRPGLLQDALQRLILQRDPAGLVALGRGYALRA